MTRYIIFLATVVFWGSQAKADIIKFQCSWENNKPITITVDDKKMKAFRDDGGNSYIVIKLTKYGVWMMVDEPENISSAALQMIQRGMASTSEDDIAANRPYKPGK